ncbi:Cytochrome c oxidase subunit [Quillaja saponaria]|uniref:Cytochrome c oxidase subunit n=1 Tax=Quillaja saponaria TaxID=32244 RepID=A0AAD7LZ36_QUISA|nr:Cytochrome c oxidase subunit [Quillaja saponaria]
MAEAPSVKTLSLTEEYQLPEKSDAGAKPKDVKEVENPGNASEESVTEKSEGTTNVIAEGNTVVIPATAEENSEVAPTAGESTEPNSAAVEDSSESATYQSSGNTEEENSGDQETAEETPEIKLETAPADFRFPTTNQSRHCFTRYIEYHRCTAAKGEDAPECEKFAKYYRSLCPGEWIDRWNEQRENGTFPGPL